MIKPDIERKEKMHGRNLVRRDAALASIVGAMGSDFGSEYGADAAYGEDPESDAETYGPDWENPSFGMDFGEDFGDDMEGEFGADDFGDDFGAVALRAPPQLRSPSAATAMAAWKRSQAMTQRRGTLLQPNAGSRITVERYSFTLSQDITLGTAVTFTTLTGSPDTRIRPQRVTMNAPSPMFAFVQSIRMANVNVTVGTGEEDAFNYNTQGVGQMLDMPTLSPSNRATVLGRYTGFVPPGFVGGTVVPFSVNFKGPSTLAAG